MSQYYRYGGQPYDYESGWRGYAVPAVRAAPGALGAAGRGLGRTMLIFGAAAAAWFVIIKPRLKR